MASPFGPAVSSDSLLIKAATLISPVLLGNSVTGIDCIAISTVSNKSVHFLTLTPVSLHKKYTLAFAEDVALSGVLEKLKWNGLMLRVSFCGLQFTMEWYKTMISISDEKSVGVSSLFSSEYFTKR